jgi:ketosteroid isomerase-like protein
MQEFLMSPNKQTVERYTAAFARSDHAAVLACLTDDVEWEVPGAFHLTGKAAFDAEIENPAFTGSPVIAVTRTTEENDVVVAEGTVRTQRRDGEVVHLRFCDVFVMRDARIASLCSYLMAAES